MMQLEDPCAEAAIGWMVEMTSGEMSEQQYRTFEVWLQSDPRNERAWVVLQEGMMPCGIAARQGLGRGVITERLLTRDQSRRTFLRAAIGTIGLGAVGAAVTDRFLPLNHVLADRFTLTAQQKRVMLADGSELMLAPQTAVDLRYREGLRAVQLLGGEVMVKVAARAASFQVGAGDVVLKAGSGTFMVERRSDTLKVSGIEGRGRVGRDGGDSHEIGRGDQLVFTGDRVRRVSADIEMTTAWIDGLLVAKDRTVASIVEGLTPYFPGIIRVDPRAADLHATGVFSLKNPNDALDALAEALGLSITRIARYWVMLGPRAA